MPLCRIVVFETRRIGKKERGTARELWNPNLDSPTLLGSGSLYWPTARAAWRRARVAARDPGVDQVKVETISARPVGRIFADGTAYAETLEDRAA